MSFLGEKKHPATVFFKILQAIWLLLNLYKLIIVCALKCFGLIRFFFLFFLPTIQYFRSHCLLENHG